MEPVKIMVAYYPKRTEKKTTIQERTDFAEKDKSNVAFAGALRG